MVIGSVMKVILLAVTLLVPSLVHCQVWNDANSGIVVRTMYLPLRKGKASLSLKDLNNIQQMQTFNIPFLPVRQNPDLPQSSTLNHNYQPSGTLNQNYLPSDTLNQNYQSSGKVRDTKQYETSVQSLQDVRPKTNYPKQEVQLQVSNYHGPYQGPTFHQQQYNTVIPPPVVMSGNPNGRPEHQIYQQQTHQSSMPTHAPSHNNNYEKNNLGNVQPNLHIAIHSSPIDNAAPQGQNHVHYVQQENSHNNFAAHPNAHNSQAQSAQYVSRPAQEIVIIPQNGRTTFAGESSRFGHQMQQQINQPAQPHQDSSPQRPSYVTSHQQIQYEQQDQPPSHHPGPAIIANSQYQSPPQQHESKNIVVTQNQQHSIQQQQQQQPVSTYAIVHQRIPTNNYGQGSPSSFEQEQIQIRQPSESSQTSYNNNNGQVEYIKMSPQQEIALEVTPKSHITIQTVQQNPVNHMQQHVKQEVPSRMNSQQSNVYQVAPPMQIAMSHYPHPQDGQYYTQQQSPSTSYQVVQAHDVKMRIPPQQSVQQQLSYPDPNSETYYPENAQIYVAPPPGYTSSKQQIQESVEHHSYARYPSNNENSVHYNPPAVPSEQVGIHIAIPSKHFATY